MRELVDLVDSSGEIKLRNVPREEADSHKDLHMQLVVAVIFNSMGEALVHKRSMEKPLKEA